ncbi:hypothetical protein MANES_12G000200v8 [Manihot esculenta]|uniref:Uncharacterized protein n=1 Tax=Manihot esculenta TaxID=3983 RepID=A0ACB7GS89_MANES|nr:hypothetical protein MANES_12G000200v8 [Manihot esculenta]
MASRAILRRKRSLFSFLNQPACLVRSFSSFEHGQPPQSSVLEGSSWITSHPSENNDSRYKGNRKADFDSSSGIRWFSRSVRFSSTVTAGQPKFGSGNSRKADVDSSSGIRWCLQSVHFSSTAADGQPKFGSGNDRNEQQAAKQVKEASPEECDEAVEDLSEVKAKAKAKQVQELQKSYKSVMQRMWAMLLGIGPALKAVASMGREDWAEKLHHWRDEFKSTMQHYWLGIKLLWADIRISSRLLVKLANGKGLSRRERQQLTRTTADIFRLVPFAVFIIVPFMEFLLPVFLKLFPNMLPSTFQDKMKEQEALKRKLNARMEYAKFLQDTVKEMAKEVQSSRSGETKKTAEDLDEFMNNVRTGARVSNEEILGFAKLFNDELTLDNVSRPRLVNMCKYMGISPYGTDAYLRYMLRRRLQEIKNDDKMIRAEGMESLSESELRHACRDRGLLGVLSVEEMRQQEEEEEEEEEQAKIKESVGSQKDVALEEMTIPTAREAQEQARANTLEKHEHLCELSRALAVLASASSVSREREEFLKLVKKEIVLYNSMVDKEGTEEEEEAKKAYKAAREESDHAVETAIADKVSSALIDRVDAMLQKLEKEIDDVDAKIGDRWRLLDRDYDGKVTPEEVASAAMYLKDHLGKEGIQDLISNLSKDREGKISVEDIVKLGSEMEDDETTEEGKEKHRI